ncbi:MAG: UvrABC system protein A [Candidatus Moranbacteria bacterium GW2011_GWA2_39_41]|nr:MAG: UvrABC system protein A [Candidatus Moranbacteria bacterium GW2011_GWA2_39_41]
MAKSTSKVRDKIIIRGAKVNNLKNVDIDIPRDQLVVVTGLSGSGKSSLAFDVVYAEGNRRYLEGMSSYARQFLDVGAKPDVDKIENLSPTISIDQKSLSRSPRSTVGTLTEIYDYLRVLFAKIGAPHCPKCGAMMVRKSNQEMLSDILSFPENTQVAILAKIKETGKNSKETLRSISQIGYARVRFNGKIMLVTEAMAIASDQFESAVEVVIDRIVVKHKNPDSERIVDSIETGLKVGNGSIVVGVTGEEDRFYNKDFVCHECRTRISEITPRHFSFNSPEGACEHCSGLGITKEVDIDLVMPNKNLSLSEGAILPWSKSNGRLGGQGNYMNILEVLGKEYGFSIDVPVKKLSKEAIDIIFFGPERKEILIEQKGDMGGMKEVRVIFEGVIPTIKKKYQEAASDYVRSDLEKYMLEKVCPSCEGKRLKDEFLAVMIDDKSIDDVACVDLGKFMTFLNSVETNLKVDRTRRDIAVPLVKEMKLKTEALINVGLEYLSISRGANSISGGEAQRIRLATQIGSELMGITYVLDEPSIGLHNRDTEKLINTMQLLKEAGNSLIVVEHDEDIIRKADWIIDMGPGAGEEGGEVIFQGDFKKLLSSKTSTAQYLTGKKKVAEKKSFRKGNRKSIEIIGATEHNLKNINVEIPLGKFVSITGVSGSGKSSLVSDILAKSLSRHFFNCKETPGAHKKIKGLDNVDKVISINQTPIGRTPRSNAATYTGVFSLIRDLFASTEEARNRAYTPSRFSFNMKGGRCEVCQGDGTKKIEMHLLPDMYVKCESCAGTRYNPKTLDIEYQGVNIAEVLDMSVSYALRFFRKSQLIVEKLSTLEQVGLGYLKLGQSATNLSGGEAQRIKLATELSRKSTGKTLYILDEPTIGLHFDDVKRLLGVLDALVDKGNSVLVVEHNVDVIRNSDWVIDIGPDGGDKGGEIVYAGTPDKLKNVKRSWTAKYI